MVQSKATRISLVPAAILAALPGCASPRHPAGDEAARQRMLSLLMPGRVEIVEPFTRVKSFDGDDLPDGIELWLQAVNSLDNPGLMIAGDVGVELFEHVEASGTEAGRRIDRWTVELSTIEQQRRYWNQLTQMYEFRLGIDPTTIPLSKRYVLAVTYNSPLGEHLTDRIILEPPSAGLRALTRAP